MWTTEDSARNIAARLAVGVALFADAGICSAHDSTQLIGAVGFLLLLPIPAIWLTLPRSSAVLALIGIWIVAGLVLFAEESIVRLTGMHLQSGALSAIVLVAPNLLLVPWIWRRFRSNDRSNGG